MNTHVSREVHGVIVVFGLGLLYPLLYPPSSLLHRIRKIFSAYDAEFLWTHSAGE